MSYEVFKCDGCGMETTVKPKEACLGCGGAWEETVHLTNGLNATAVATLAEAGLTPEQWIEANSYGYVPPEGEPLTWTGDRCGCSDSRCIGFHHLAEDDCGCLPVLIEMQQAGNL